MRCFVRFLQIALWVLAATGMIETLRAADGKQAPNVLMICADDMNDWLACLRGHPNVQTPHLDRLACRGVLFTNAHAPATTCNPSRTAVLTGLRPSTTGVYGNGQWWRPALPDAVTLPEHFKAHGYYVAGGGKVYHWHSRLGGFNPPEQWHEYFRLVYDEPAHRAGPGAAEFTGFHWPHGFPLNGLEAVRLGKHPPMGPRQFDWGPLDRSDLEMGDGQMVTWASEFLKREHDRPFFLAAGIFRPHLPWYAPSRYFEPYSLDDLHLPETKEDDLDDVPERGRRMALARTKEYELVARSGQYRSAVRAYLASISFVDALVGRLLEALERGPCADNTIVVFWSDHGFHLGEKRHWHKSTLWERSTHVPLLITVPGRKGDAICDSPVSLLDIYPTLIELCGLSPREELDGASLVPLLERPEAAMDRAVVTTSGRGSHAVRSRHWRYIRYADGTEELYDHRTDPHEWTNLAEDPDCEQVRRELARCLPRTDAPSVPGFGAYHFDKEKYCWSRK
jgi:arylsulfatase A-like enzyme